jgi:hypothetical protein
MPYYKLHQCSITSSSNSLRDKSVAQGMDNAFLSKFVVFRDVALFH